MENSSILTINNKKNNTTVPKRTIKNNKRLLCFTSLKERNVIIFNQPHVHILPEIALLIGMGRQQAQIVKSLLLKSRM